MRYWLGCRGILDEKLFNKINVMLKTKVFLIIILFLIFLPLVASADILIHTKTKVYFEKAGQPVDKPIEFTISCYGYSWPPGTGGFIERPDKPVEKVFTFTAVCLEYGCTLDDEFFTRNMHIDYCNMEGVIDNKESFAVYNYSDSPMSNCKDTGIDWNIECEIRVDLPADIVSKASNVAGYVINKADVFLTKPLKDTYQTQFIIALIVTLLIEVLLLYLLAKYVFKIYKKPIAIILIGILASALTLPYLWFLLSPSMNFYLAELSVVIIEAIIYMLLLGIRLWKAFLLALLLNIASVVAGLLLF